MPRSLSSASLQARSSVASGSRLALGSSRIRALGPCERMEANPTFCFCPSDSSWMEEDRIGPSRKARAASSILAAMASGETPCHSWANASSSSTFRAKNCCSGS